MSVLTTMLRNCSSDSSRPRVLSGELEILAHGRRRLAEPAGRDLLVLLADGAGHVAGSHAAGGQLLRVEPDAHAVVARAEELHVADARDAGQRVLELMVA